uniref:Uncharacterized protein n=1 Tax=Chlamydomonas leiostraca TaxID=1034604 RepID=A0A7S0NB31_9CHLO|mmetsp:Transcript_1178/g.3331  ORF Transcript_1178/g.3331 Transcript_1178/m.3331 type:complete len:470 (+) Transcript_1178:2061-3470(+)
MGVTAAARGKCCGTGEGARGRCDRGSAAASNTADTAGFRRFEAPASRQCCRQQQPPQQQPAAAQPGAGGGASKVNNMAAALVARMSAGGQSLAGQRALRSVMVRHLCSMQLDLLSYHLPNLDRPPLFGKRPQYIKPQPTNTVTAQWLSRIFVEHGSQRLHLFTAAGELPPAFAKAISNELVVSEFILRKTIPIDHIEGKPMVMWPVKETTLIQGHGLVQLSDARVGAVVHLDDGRQMVISPQKVEEFLVIVGVMLEAGVRCSAPANEQEAARVKEVAESVVKTVAREVPADHELASALAIMRAEETGAAVAASGAGAAPGGSNGAAGGRVVSPNHQTVAVHMVSATGAPPAAAPVAAVAPGPSPARGAVAAMDQVQAGGALAGNGPALAAAAAAARTAPAPEQQSAPAGGAGADAGAPGAAPVGDAGQQGGEGGAAAEAAAAADPAGAAAVDAPPSPSTPTVLKPEDGA